MAITLFNLPPETIIQITEPASNTDPRTFARLRKSSSRFRDLRIPQTTREYLKELDHYTSLRTQVLSLPTVPRPEGPMSLDYFLNHVDRLQHAAGLRQDAPRRFHHILQNLRGIRWWPPGCTVEYAMVHGLSARVVRLERSIQLQQVRDRLERRGLRICHRCCRTVSKTQGFRRSRQTPCIECRPRRLAEANEVWPAQRPLLRSEEPSQRCPVSTYSSRMWWWFLWIAFFPPRVLEAVIVWMTIALIV